MSEAEETIRAWQEWGAKLPKLTECCECGELMQKEEGDTCAWCAPIVAKCADTDAAIETLRVMLLEHAAGQASAVRETRVDPWSNSEDTTDLEHGACIAIAMALLL